MLTKDGCKASGSCRLNLSSVAPTRATDQRVRSRAAPGCRTARLPALSRPHRTTATGSTCAACGAHRSAGGRPAGSRSTSARSPRSNGPTARRARSLTRSSFAAFASYSSRTRCRQSCVGSWSWCRSFRCLHACMSHQKHSVCLDNSSNQTAYPASLE